jgi:Putative prokaryotic signal transducing protein
MNDEMVTLATFANTIEAEMVKNLLADEGIPAFVIGETSGTLFSGMTNLFGEVRLLVAESNLERATAILEEDEDDEDLPETEPLPEPGTAFKAGDWAREPSSRKGTVDDSIRAVPGVKEAPEADAALRTEEVKRVKEVEKDDDEEEDAELRVDWGPDDHAARAWKASIIGLLMFPPLLHLYSLSCLVQVFFGDESPSPAGLRKAVAAGIIDVLVIVVVLFLLCSGVVHFGILGQPRNFL